MSDMKYMKCGSCKRMLDMSESTSNIVFPGFIKDCEQKLTKKDIQKNKKNFSDKNREVNKMNECELREKLSELNLEERGILEILQKRLKHFYKINQFSEADTKDSDNLNLFYDNIVVIDFEATCEEVKPLGYKHEIIEFPAVLINVQSMKIISEFHSYIQPVINPKLTDFCTQLTGISQENVENSPMFPEVMHQFENWLKENNLNFEGGVCRSFAIATDSPCDMGYFLLQHCNDSLHSFPEWAKHWINIKKGFCNFYKTGREPLSHMLEKLGLEFEGRPHSGMDDARNIARIVITLLKDGCYLRLNEKIQLDEDGKPDAGQRHVCNLTNEDFEHLRDIKKDKITEINED
ncbi:unnamed protein product, partial [Meganyctiphanes norvegica]